MDGKNLEAALQLALAGFPFTVTLTDFLTYLSYTLAPEDLNIGSESVISLHTFPSWHRIHKNNLCQVLEDKLFFIGDAVFQEGQKGRILQVH